MSVGRRVVLKVTKLGRYFRTTVPGEVRKLLNLREGDEIIWILENNKIVVEKAEGGEG
ncbi:MAG: hypothetical protein DRN04_11440 [Thermoprotei archaeon]|nr:MAG: hypothetical protein DRN04_11440 [Thermoprotei archaeon]